MLGVIAFFVGAICGIIVGFLVARAWFEIVEADKNKYGLDEDLPDTVIPFRKIDHGRPL